MTISEVKHLCLSHPGTTFDFPFGPDTAVFRVGGKMFAVMGIDSDVPTDKIEWLIGHSFELVRDKLTKSKRPGI